MGEAILIIYLAGTGMTFEPVRTTFPSMTRCQAHAASARQRGHSATCRYALPNHGPTDYAPVDGNRMDMLGMPTAR